MTTARLSSATSARPSAHLALNKVGVAEAELIIGERAALGKKSAHNHLTLHVAMLNFAHALGWLACMRDALVVHERAFSRS